MTDSQSFERIKKMVLQWIKHPKFKNILIIAGVLGVALIFISEILPSGAEKQADVSADSATSADEYVKELETRLLGIVGSINGVGEAQVLVTLENGIEYVFANEEKSNVNYSEDTGSDGRYSTDEKSNTEKNLILIEDSNGKKQALVRTEIQPKVKGVIIVCEGGDDPTVQQRLISVITTALDISSKRVCVTRLSK